MALFGEPNVDTLRSKGDVKGLMRALDYKNNIAVRRDAAIALGEIGDSQVVDALIAAFKDNNSEVIIASISALGQIGGPQVVIALGNLLYSKDDEIRMKSVDALGKIADPQVVNALVTRLYNEENEKICEKISDVLVNYSDLSVELLIKGLEGGETLAGFSMTPSVRTYNTAKALIKFGEKAVESLVELVGNSNFNIRSSAAKSLISIGECSVSSLIDALEDPSWDKSRGASEALGDFNEMAVDPLISVLENKTDARVRTLAASALKTIASPRAIQPLFGALKDKDHVLREVAAEALCEIGTLEAVLELKALLADEKTEKGIRTVISRALKTIPWDPTDQEASFDRLIKELIQIGKTVKNPADSASGFLFLDSHRNAINQPRARKIGEILNKNGGMEMMRRAHAIIREKQGKISARELEFCWGYIGDWRP